MTMINVDFMVTFPSTQTQFLSPSFSDQCASVTQFGLSLPRVPSPFRFLNFLTKNSSFPLVLSEVWNSASFYGCKQFILSKKLKALKPALRKLNRDYNSNIHISLDDERHMLHLLQLDNLSSPHPSILQVELAQSKLVHDLPLLRRCSYFKNLTLNV